MIFLEIGYVAYEFVQTENARHNVNCQTDITYTHTHTPNLCRSEIRNLNVIEFGYVPPSDDKKKDERENHNNIQHNENDVSKQLYE